MAETASKGRIDRGAYFWPNSFILSYLLILLYKKIKHLSSTKYNSSFRSDANKGAQKPNARSCCCIKGVNIQKRKLSLTIFVRIIDLRILRNQVEVLLSIQFDKFQKNNDRHKKGEKLLH